VLRFVKRLNYRDRVHEHLNALLVGYPAGRQFADDFPSLRDAIRSRFEAGVSAPSAALQLAAEIVSGLLGQLDAAGKVRVAEGMLRLDREQAAAMASRFLAGAREEPADRLSFATELAGLAVFMAARMADEGTLRRGEYDYLVAAIEEALGAEAAQAGSKHGLACSLTRIFLLCEEPASGIRFWPLE
jgi:hypothetical protein